MPNFPWNYDEFEMPGSTLDPVRPSDSVPDYDPESYAVYQPQGGSRADDFESRLASFMGKFDKNNNFGINDQDRAVAKDAKWVELGNRLSKAGFSHSYAGYGNAMQGLGGAMGRAEEASLNEQSTENLRTELAKLDMEEKLSAAEKNRLALKIAQDDYEAKERSRRMGADVFAQELPPEKINMLVSSIKLPSDQAHARMAFARMKLYMEAGDHDKAAEVSKEIDSLIPEKIQQRVDQLFAAKEAESNAEVVGKGKGQIETAKNLPPGMEMGSGGNVQSIDPLDALAKRSNIAYQQAQINNMNETQKLNREKLDKESAKELEISAREEGKLARAADAIMALRAKGLSLDREGNLIYAKTGSPVPDMELRAGPNAELYQRLYSQAIDAKGVMAGYPQLSQYGAPTVENIRKMLADLRSGKSSATAMQVAPKHPTR